MKSSSKLSDEKDIHHAVLEKLLHGFDLGFDIKYIRNDSIGSHVNLSTREIYWDYLSRHIYVSNEFGNREEINCDGVVDIEDLTRLARTLVGIYPTLCPTGGCPRCE